MRRIAIVLPLVLTACPASRFADSDEAGGRLEVRAEGGGRLLAAPAIATWCAAESSLTVIAIADDGAGGVAARVSWPPAGDTLRIERRLRMAGMATFAWRPLGDSLRTALAADSGFVVLRGDSASVSGSAAGWATTNDTTHVRMLATLRDIPVLHRCQNAP